MEPTGNSQLKRLFTISLFLGVVVIALLIFGSVVKAGSLNPSSSPAATSYTLGDIYLRLTTNATATEANHLFAPGASPASSLYTLKQIYDAIPTIDVSKVLSGTSYLGKDGAYNAANLSTSTVKKGTSFGVSSTGALTPNDGTATVADLFAGATANLTADWTPDTGTLNLACNVSTFDASGNLVPNTYDGSGDGSNRWCMTDSGNAATSDIALNKIAWVDGKALTGTLYGDTSAAKVLTTATYTGAYNAANLSTSTVKKGTLFGVSSTGAFSGYPGTEWVANGSGDGSTALNQTNCEAAYSSGNYRWQWFEDTNGDGDTTDAEDGMCLLMCTGAGCTNTANYSNDAYLSASWNGAEQMSVSLAVQTATGGSASTVVKSSAGWTADAYKNSITKITSGAAINCWGLVRTNSTDTITVYGSWLTSAYAACGANPGNTDTFQIYQDNMYDNSWIGDWTCSGNFPTGAVSWGSYPTSGQVGANLIALATADCLDGKRDLLPNESDRAVITGTATAGTSGTTLEDTTLALDVNTWMGQKIKITSGANSGSTGIVESNTATTLTVLSWSSGAPSTGNTYQVIYITPFASYQPNTSICGSTSCIKHNKGPLTTENLNNWKGTRLPTSMDFFGVCGSGSAKKIIGNYGSQNGRTDEYLNEANDSLWEWLSEPYYHYLARVAGGFACSFIGDGNVHSSHRFRAVFRP